MTSREPETSGISCSHWGMFEGSDPQYIITVRDSRGVFTFEQWRAMPPEIPLPLKPWWRE
jgi:hypothetical protein